jgi:hypothetical protein
VTGQVGQAEDLPADHEREGEEENERREHGTDLLNPRAIGTSVKIAAQRRTVAGPRQDRTVASRPDQIRV